MSDRTERTPLAVIETFESVAFRASHVARQLLADHADLPLWMLSIRGASSSHMRDADMADVELQTPSVDDVRVWAEALGGEVVVNVYGGSGVTPPFAGHKCQVRIAGVCVEVASSRELSEDEAVAWRAERAAATEGGTS